MAASVLLGSADNTGLNFTVGGNSGNVLVRTNNGLGPAGPAPWNRSLDRALDEASATGCLNLSGRKLKEFPRSAANHDLTDTTRADLSRNRLSELPLEVCLFVSLESLNLYQNCLRSLPDSMINLQALTYLNLSRNQLSVLPAVVCSLPLKVLITCNNKLVSLPEELGQLRHLTELDVSCNEIQTLPSQVGQLEALRDLNIRRNHLVRLPPELAELPLVRLDFSCNKVTSIPICYRRLTQLQTIVLDNNPLQTPPAQICIKGKIHIFKYLNLEASKTTPDLPDYDRRPLTFSSCIDELYPGRPYGALDSGFNSVDSGDKRWSGNEPAEELSELPQRVAELSRDQRQKREDGRGGGLSLLPHVVTVLIKLLTSLHQSLHFWPSGSFNLAVSVHSALYHIPAPEHRDIPAVSLCLVLSNLMISSVQNIEARLKVSLPSDLGAALTDGVVLCHLANHVRPRSVSSIHVPSPAVPKLTMAKCRRNVENFLEACRRIGVPQDSLCSVGEVLEGTGTGVYRTVGVLLSMAPPLIAPFPRVQLAGFALFYLAVMSLLCAIYVHLAQHV
uniref:Calponin-homology (CH) domain-containing protein n=1 Tax=Anabas testudineus TaxID=64144 RepID=A0A7N6B7F1_ANATE